jgi:hypothetical protein
MIDLDTLDVQVSADEGDFVWSCRFSLKDINDYGKFSIDDAFEVQIGTDVYQFVVDSIELSRGAPANVEPRIIGVSPGVKYDFPRADPYTKEWDANVTAKDAAEHAIGGDTIQWDIVNWTLPAYRLSVEDVAPISVVQEIAEAAGAVVESNLDGTLRVRYRHPVSVPDYATTTPSHVVTEKEDIVTTDERSSPEKLTNRVRVLDIDADFTDFLEFEAITTSPNILQGTLKAYPGPWREINLIDTHDTRDPGEIVMVYTGIVVEVVEDEDGVGELLEIYGGVTSASKPVWGITELTWESTNLGSVAYTPGSTTLKFGDEDSFGLIRLRYTTKYHAYHVVYSSGIDVSQFVLEDLIGDV